MTFVNDVSDLANGEQSTASRSPVTPDDVLPFGGTEQLYPVTRYKTGTQHLIYAAGDAEDGSLWGMFTLCGYFLEFIDDWKELTRHDIVTCKRCLKSKEIRHD